MKKFFQNKMFSKIALSTLAVALVLGGFLSLAPQAHADAITSIDVTSPDGNENWSGVQNITWTSVGNTDGGEKVDILYCTTDCVGGTVIQLNVADDSDNPTNTYSWDTVGLNGSNYKIKIVSHDSPAIYNLSNIVLTVDNTKPTTSGAATGTGGTEATDFYYTTDVEYTLTPADAPSGVARTYYCTAATNDCVPETAYTTPIILNSDGNNYVRWTSTDNAGNVQDVTSSGLILIDKTNPTVDAGSFANPIKVATASGATASDGASGIATYLWAVESMPVGASIGVSNPNIINPNLSAAGETPLDGTYVVRLTVTDHAGRTNTDTVSFIWDSTVPTIGVASIVGISNTGANDTIAITFTDANAVSATDGNWADKDEITSIAGSLSGALTLTNATFSYSAPTLTITLDEATDHEYLTAGETLHVLPAASAIQDAAGNFVANAEIEGTTLVGGDTTPPTVALTYSADQTAYKDGATLTVTATFNEEVYGAGAGNVPQIYISQPGVGTNVNNADMTISGDDHKIWTYSWTVNGNGGNGLATITIIAKDYAGIANTGATNNTKNVDNLIPTIESVTGRTIASGEDTIVIHFSETVDRTTNWAAAFDTITSGGVSLDFSDYANDYNFNGTDTLTLTLSEVATNTATYLRNNNTIIITPKVNEIHDLADNHVAVTPITSAAITGNDTTAPTVALTYSPNEYSYIADDHLQIIATFNEAIAETAFPHLVVTVGSGASSGVMSKTSNTVWYYDWTIPSGVVNDGLVTFGIANATDLAGNANATATNNTKTIDAVPSIVNSFTAGSIASTSATLTVLTNKITTCSYSSIDSSYSSMTVMGTTTNVTTHVQALSGLNPATRYDYYVRCQDNHGNTMVNSAHVSFTTTGSDVIAPHVDAQTPATIDQAITVSPTITFSEAMDAATINSGTIKLRKYDDSDVTVTLNYNPSTYVVTLDPDANLANSTQYYLWVSGAKDVAGNTVTAYTNKADQDFTTVAAETEPSAGLTVDTMLTHTGETSGLWSTSAGSGYGDAYEWVFGVTLPNGESAFSLQFSDWTNGLAIDHNMRYWSEEVDHAALGGSDNPVIISEANSYADTEGGIVITEDASPWTPTSGQAGIQTNIHVQMQIPSATPAGSHSASYKILTDSI